MLRLIDKHWKEHLLNLDMLAELERLPEELKAKTPNENWLIRRLEK